MTRLTLIAALVACAAAAVAPVAQAGASSPARGTLFCSD